MFTQKSFSRLSIAIALIAMTGAASAQTKKYQRPKPVQTIGSGATTSAPDAAAPSTDGKTAATPAKDEKLDVSELEQKYWAPKDTDFSVVQNRTYTKAHRFSVSAMGGPIVNDPFNSGYNWSLSTNYYLSERFGFEAMYIDSNLGDSKAVDNFKNLSGGGTLPDFNRPVSYYGVGINYVPFYAKMSFMGKKIIYFDMQVTPHIGMSTWQQLAADGIDAKEDSSFSYGLDITQYFFFSNHFAARVNLHNRWYSEDVISYIDGSDQGSETTNVTNLLLGVTFFF